MKHPEHHGTVALCSSAGLSLLCFGIGFLFGYLVARPSSAGVPDDRPAAHPLHRALILSLTVAPGPGLPKAKQLCSQETFHELTSQCTQCHLRILNQNQSKTNKDKLQKYRLKMISHEMRGWGGII